MSSIPSLENPPNAPKKKPELRPLPNLHIVRRNLFPSPPPAPRKPKTTVERDTTPIPLQFEMEELMVEMEWLASTGDVREELVIDDFTEIIEETDRTYLLTLRDLFFPAFQPRNLYEEAYLMNVKDIIDFRLDTLHM
jgi:hypothetical protein